MNVSRAVLLGCSFYIKCKKNHAILFELVEICKHISYYIESKLFIRLDIRRLFGYGIEHYLHSR